MLAISRQIDVGEDAAARAERKTGHVRGCACRFGARNVQPPGRASALPSAFTATARAAITYCSMNDGDTCRPAAMLSKPSTTSSAGSTPVASKSTARDRERRWRIPCD